MNDWSLADIVRRATELYIRRFPDYNAGAEGWSFPTLEVADDYLTDPADMHAEADAIALRSRS